jgi:hypothetical protein
MQKTPTLTIRGGIYTLGDPGIMNTNTHLRENNTQWLPALLPHGVAPCIPTHVFEPSSFAGGNGLVSRKSAVQFIIGQSVNFARLHMSAHPFQLFSIGILIFGSQFCVAIFDRGITLSPIHDMWTDLNIFIQVIRRLSCDLSPKELG